MTTEFVCRRCKKEIPPGGVFYNVILTVISGFDGVLDPDGYQDVDEALMNQIKDSHADQLERGVYFEEEVVLCAVCKEEVTDSFLNELDMRGSISSGGPEGRLH